MPPRALGSVSLRHPKLRRCPLRTLSGVALSRSTARWQRPVASCFTTTGPMATSTWTSPSHFAVAGLGSFLVQELKRVCYEDWASCRQRAAVLQNVASQRTLQKAGFVPCGHILTGAVPTQAEPVDAS